MSDLNDKLSGIPATLSVALIDAEIDELSRQIDIERNERRKDYLSAAYQALRWARNPDGYALPSEHKVPRPRLTIISGKSEGA